MAKKKTKPEVTQEEEIIEEHGTHGECEAVSSVDECVEDTQDIELYEIDDRYGITPDGIVYDLEKETALVPVLDDIGRPCVKINRKRIPIDELKRKYLPDEIRDEINEHNNYNKSKSKSNLNNFKLEGKTYADIFEASKDLGITANVIRAYLITRK